MSDEWMIRADRIWHMLATKANDAALAESAALIEETGAIHAIYLTGLALARLNRPQATTWLTAALSLAAAPEDWYVNAAVAARGNGQHQLAHDFARDGVARFPDNAQLLYLKGTSLCNLQQDWAVAVDALERAMAVRPDFLDAAMSRGYALHMLDRYDEALAVYTPFLQMERGSEHETLVDVIVCLLLELGRQEEAYAVLNKHYPVNTQPHTWLTRSFLELGLGMWPKAWDTYRHRGTVVDVVADEVRPRSLSDIRGQDVALMWEQPF